MKGIWFILMSILLSVSGQLSLKRAMIELGDVNLKVDKIIAIVIQLLTTPLILAGLALYGISAFFWLVALSKVDLSYAYPMLSLGYVLASFLSWWLFNENVTLVRLLGTVVICFGVYLISRS